MECRAASKRQGRAATVDSGDKGRARRQARQQAQATTAPIVSGFSRAAPAKLGSAVVWLCADGGTGGSVL